MMSETFPPPMPQLKKVRKVAYKKGTWVTGTNVNNLQGFIGHKGHIIVIVSPPKERVLSYAGYSQDARCLRCGQLWVDVDGEFLQVLANHDYIMAELKEIDLLKRRLHRVARIIAKEITKT